MGESGDLAERGEVVGEQPVAVETASVLHRRWLRHTLSDQRSALAVDHLPELDLDRVPTRHLLTRTFELRANVSAHDACYLALAERLDCSLLTGDIPTSRRDRTPLPRASLAKSTNAGQKTILATARPGRLPSTGWSLPSSEPRVGWPLVGLARPRCHR